jgi:hypothetical protein
MQLEKRRVYFNSSWYALVGAVENMPAYAFLAGKEKMLFCRGDPQ